MFVDLCIPEGILQKTEIPLWSRRQEVGYMAWEISHALMRTMP